MTEVVLCEVVVLLGAAKEGIALMDMAMFPYVGDGMEYGGMEGYL